MNMKSQTDYSLYLVTDSTEAILGNRDLVDVADQALQGGVTIVQYRDKTSDTGLLISIAKALHTKCRQYNVPLIINDRVDVALAVGCEGVHLGQDDMSIAAARQILGEDKIIGATVSSIEEADVAVERGADYLGIGTLYATNTKKNTKDIIGINGIRKILFHLNSHSEKARSIKTVCIGGVNASNLQRVIFQLQAPSSTDTPPKIIDGAAIVSAIINSPDPKAASQTLKTLLTTSPPFARTSSLPPFQLSPPTEELSAIQREAPKYVKAVSSRSSLSHNMTNLVVQHISASVALAIGASPIMSNNGNEASDLAALHGGLVINMGTATPDALHNHALAIAAYNAVGGPVVFDPVGAGATSARRSAVSTLLKTGYFDVIKGNEREILAVAKASGFTVDFDSSQQRGVDSGATLFALKQRASIVQRIAARERNIVLMTGAVDVVSDGYRTYAIKNGHEYLGLITGSGCTLGTTISAYLAAAVQAGREGVVEKEEGSGWEPDKLYAVLTAILHFEIAAERAASRSDVQGPGTFIPAFVDELWKIRTEVDKGDVAWLESKKITVLQNLSDVGLLREV